MVRSLKAWSTWTVLFLCACSAAVPPLPAGQRDENILVVRPASYQPVEITRGEYREGMQMLFSRGPLPGTPRVGSSRFILASTDPWQLQKAAGYLQFCERIGRGPGDCWEVLTPAGGLDESGTRDVALRFAFAEAIADAATAIGSITPDQVRAILGLALVGTIVSLLSPEPVSKYLFIITTANLIAFIGVDIFNNVVKGYAAMAEELAQARDFAQVRAAGEQFGARLGPTVARLVMLLATYGIAKMAGLFPGGATSLPGGSRAAALAEAQGFQIPAVEGARSVSLAANGSVTIQLGGAVAMAAAGQAGSPSVADGKPLYKPNPAHTPGHSGFNPAKTIEPPDAAEVYKHAILGPNGKWYGRSASGDIYRFSPDNAGGAHFSGSTGGQNGLSLDKIPIEVRRALGTVR